MGTTQLSMPSAEFNSAACWGRCVFRLFRMSFLCGVQQTRSRTNHSRVTHWLSSQTSLLAQVLGQMYAFPVPSGTGPHATPVQSTNGTLNASSGVQVVPSTEQVDPPAQVPPVEGMQNSSEKQ
jgi:hypothetical protein